MEVSAKNLATLEAVVPQKLWFKFCLLAESRGMSGESLLVEILKNHLGEYKNLNAEDKVKFLKELKAKTRKQ